MNQNNNSSANVTEKTCLRCAYKAKCPLQFDPVMRSAYCNGVWFCPRFSQVGFEESRVIMSSAGKERVYRAIMN